MLIAATPKMKIFLHPKVISI